MWINRNTVVLPAPEAPVKNAISPFLTWSDTSSSAWPVRP